MIEEITSLSGHDAWYVNDVEAVSSAIRILVIDDHPAIQDALASTIRTRMGIDVCGVASSAEKALKLAEERLPDLAVVDISLEDAHGLDLVQNLRAQHPDLRVVIFSMYDESIYAERALRAGASGYVMKSEPTPSVVEAIRMVAQGEIYLSQRMTSHILSKMMQIEGGHEEQPLDELSDREMTVFQMLGQGCSVEDIAERLSLSRKTVETYRRRAKEKLGFDSVSELLQYAIQWINTGSMQHT